MCKSFLDISRRIDKGTAVVMTSQEVCDMAASGKRPEADVVTAATRAVMSGTYSVLSFPVARPGSFLRAKSAWINGVPAQVGPCPNENLGILDLIVFGTAHSVLDPRYGGGHLFRDLVERRSVLVEIELPDGRRLNSEVGLDEMPHARLFGSRHAFMNYSAFVNPGKLPVSTIFHSEGFSPNSSGATFSGCGQINPLKNDPLLDAVGIGTRVLINGAKGYVLGPGTRSTAQRPNLSGFADMHEMDPEYMGGFLTSAGPECIASWAVPIPVTSQSIIDAIAQLDREIPLPIMDVNTRLQIGEADYGQVWDGVDLRVEFVSDRCVGCESCSVARTCPMGAVSFEGSRASVDETLCFNCGACVAVCKGRAFSCEMGAIRLKDRSIPVVLRQSDRRRALKLAELLREKILDGSFKVSQMAERISL